MRPRIRQRLTQRQVANAMEFMGGGVEMLPPKTRGPTGTQKESAVNDAVKDWARIRQGVLYRNRRGMADLPKGGKMPFGLGPNGYGDLVGYLTIQITPEMIGRNMAVFSMIESKRPKTLLDRGGVEEDHQRDRILEVRAAGGIAGFARDAEQAEAIYQEWRNGFQTRR